MHFLASRLPSTCLRQGERLLAQLASSSSRGEITVLSFPSLGNFPFSSASNLDGTSATLDSPTKLPFIADYLVVSCGFSVADAMRLAKPIAHVNSQQKPDRVLQFLKGLGLDRRQIKDLVSWNSKILMANVDKTLKPKVQALRDLGFSDEELAVIIAANPSALRLTKIMQKIEFLRSHLPIKEDLLKALKRDPTLLHCNLAETIVPNVALLREVGVPEVRISKALFGMPWLLTRKANSFRDLLERTMALGFHCSSGLFLYGLHSICRLSNETLDGKRKLMMSFGWSEDDFLTAFRKAPKFLTNSEEKLGTAMRFWLKEVGCEPKDIATRPLMLMFSLEGRVVPRHRVYQVLRSEGLYGGERSLFSLLNLSEEKFWNIYVFPHIENIPALRGLYIAYYNKKASKEIEQDVLVI